MDPGGINYVIIVGPIVIRIIPPIKNMTYLQYIKKMHLCKNCVSRVNPGKKSSFPEELAAFRVTEGSSQGVVFVMILGRRGGKNVIAVALHHFLGVNSNAVIAWQVVLARARYTERGGSSKIITVTSHDELSRIRITARLHYTMAWTF